jgi:hypothetical protein
VPDAPELVKLLDAYSGATGVALLPAAKAAAQAFWRHDIKRNAFREVRAVLREERPSPGDTATLDDVYEQLCRQTVDPDFLAAINQLLDGRYAAAGALRQHLVAHLTLPNTRDQGAIVELIVATLVGRAGRAQKDPKAAADVAASLGAGRTIAAVEASTAQILDRLDGIDKAKVETLDRFGERASKQLESKQGADVSQVLETLDRAPEWTRKAMKALAKANAGEYRWFVAELGDLYGPEEIRELVHRWPDELSVGSQELLTAVVRHLEQYGLWSDAAEIWERLAGRYAGVLRADHLTRAAVASGVAGKPQRRLEFLEMAAKAAGTEVCARLEVELLDDADLAPREHLERLGELGTTDEPLAALIAGKSALCALLLPDVPLAQAHLQTAKKLDPDSVATRSVEVNIAVQESRIAVRENQAPNLARLSVARSEALALRERLRDWKRYEESGRLLMLAADTHVALIEIDEAQSLLEQASAEEIAAPDGAEVLADAALRAQAPRLAGRWIAGAPETAGVRRIRATADLQTAGSHRIMEAVAELEELARQEGPEQELAANARLVACFPPISAEWDEQAAKLLTSKGHERAAVGMRVMSLAARGRVIDAQEMLDGYGDESWVAELRLRVALKRGNHVLIRQAAERLLQKGPDAGLRLLCGRSFKRVGDLGLAKTVLAGVAFDDGAARPVRGEAFSELMHIAADEDEWEVAKETLARWQRLEPPDERVNLWQPRVANRWRRR